MNRSVAYRCPGSAVILLTLAALILARLGAGAQAPGPAAKAETARAGNAQNGKQIFTSFGCYECHACEGQVSSVAGPRIGPHPIPFSAFVRYVRQPAGEMPPYTSKVVSESELADIYAFLQSLPEPPAAKSIRLLN